MDGESTAYNKLESLLLDPSSVPRELPLDFLRKITNNFSDDERLLGNGGFGKVYKGVLQNGDIVAVKKLQHLNPGIQQNQFENEVYNLMRLKHANIVRFLGYCYETQNTFVEFNGKYVFAETQQMLLCLEYMSNGSLDGYVSGESLDWETCYKIIKGVCCGLHYLHKGCRCQINGSIVHMDLKPGNILLDDNMVPKVADFGLSRLLDGNKTKTRAATVMGTYGYMAPEYMFEKEITAEADIYSLGVIIIEIITGAMFDPFDFIRVASSEDFIRAALKSWTDRLKEAPSESESEQMKFCLEIALACVNQIPKDRPKTKKIIEKLNGPMPPLFSASDEDIPPAELGTDDETSAENRADCRIDNIPLGLSCHQKYSGSSHNMQKPERQMDTLHKVSESGKNASNKAVSGLQDLAIGAPQLPVEQLHGLGYIGSIWDASKLLAAVDTIGISMELLVGLGLSDSVVPAVKTFPSVQNLDEQIIDSSSMIKLQQMLCNMPDPDRAKEILRLYIVGKQEADISRSHMNCWILHKYPEYFPNPRILDRESVNDWVRKLKITTKLICLMRSRSAEQNIILEVANEYVVIVLRVASSFSGARWTADHIGHMLAIFDTLADVLFNIYLSCSGCETTGCIVEIFRQMEMAFCRVLEVTANDTGRMVESDGIHSSTCFLMQVLTVFNHNKAMVEAVHGTGDHTINLYNCWISKLEEDTARIFKHEKDKKYISILNNIYIVWAMESRPRYPVGPLSADAQERLQALMNNYIAMYVDEYWSPLVEQRPGRPVTSFLRTFNINFARNCDRQKSFRLPARLKCLLRNEIKELTVPPYSEYLSNKLSTNGRSKPWKYSRYSEINYTVDELQASIDCLFES